MKKIGLVGGISWEATMEYYRLINQGIGFRLENQGSVECVIYSLNLTEILGRGWEKSFHLLLNACGTLKRSGVDCIVLCAHTAHLFAERLEAAIHLPIIHIATETAKILKAQGLGRVALLSNNVIMNHGFYSRKLEEFGLEVLVPAEQDLRDFIYPALGEGKETFNHRNVKDNCTMIINQLVNSGADCVLLSADVRQQYIEQDNCSVPLIDSRLLHCEAAISFIISQDTHEQP